MSNFFKHKLRSKSPGEIVGWIFLAIIAVIGLAILFGLVIMWLWNWLMVDLFNLAEINYWQAVGLFILFKILLGSCGGGDGKGSCDSDHSSSKKKESKNDFSKWKHYDSFWKEEGDQAYQDYIKRKNGAAESNDGTEDAALEKE